MPRLENVHTIIFFHHATLTAISIYCCYLLLHDIFVIVFNDFINMGIFKAKVLGSFLLCLSTGWCSSGPAVLLGSSSSLGFLSHGVATGSADLLMYQVGFDGVLSPG
jgi:hypothetical protein